MNISKFKAGAFTNRFGYRCFIPDPINREWKLTTPELLDLLEEANHRLGELNGISMLFPQVDTFLRMHMVKEATQSSRIEGTRTEMDEAVLDARDINPEKKDDWQEVHNYIEAMNFSIRALKKLPLSSRLLRQAHEILLKGVRGKHKSPGNFRTSQNWIGGATLKDARFVPPHASLVPELISDLEKFLNNTHIHVPHLLRIAMAHYQFEAIHPFLDGNGRIGRLMITLYLVHTNTLNRPVLYLSDFIEKNRQHYYDNLTRVSHNNDMEQWLKFFLVGVIETSKDAASVLHDIVRLRKKVENKTIIDLGRRIPAAKDLLQFLYSKPVTTAQEIEKELAVSKQTAHNLIADFLKLKILKEQTGQKRNRIFVFEEYMRLFRR
ncbi:MAG: Fic family protein [Bacteroidia bacterium]